MNQRKIMNKQQRKSGKQSGKSNLSNERASLKAQEFVKSTGVVHAIQSWQAGKS